jgi:putative toxin-antitoxin system antitoxin component (TIGR02293 family)
MMVAKATAKPAAGSATRVKEAATTARIASKGVIVKSRPLARSAGLGAHIKLIDISRTDSKDLIAVIREGIPAASIADLSSRMGISKENLLNSLGLSRATISRKEREDLALSKDESERVLGVQSLIEQVQTMIEESGDPTGFDAARWVAEWLAKPLPALGGETPASYMDTFAGQKLVSELLSYSQSGAYA